MFKYIVIILIIAAQAHRHEPNTVSYINTGKFNQVLFFLLTVLEKHWLNLTVIEFSNTTNHSLPNVYVCELSTYDLSLISCMYSTENTDSPMYTYSEETVFTTFNIFWDFLFLRLKIS